MCVCALTVPIRREVVPSTGDQKILSLLKFVRQGEMIDNVPNAPAGFRLRRQWQFGIS